MSDKSIKAYYDAFRKANIGKSMYDKKFSDYGLSGEQIKNAYDTHNIPTRMKLGQGVIVVDTDSTPTLGKDLLTMCCRASVLNKMSCLFLDLPELVQVVEGRHPFEVEKSDLFDCDAIFISRFSDLKTPDNEFCCSYQTRLEMDSLLMRLMEANRSLSLHVDGSDYFNGWSSYLEECFINRLSYTFNISKGKK